jgi:hypothetical protein
MGKSAKSSIEYRAKKYQVGYKWYARDPFREPLLAPTSLSRSAREALTHYTPPAQLFEIFSRVGESAEELRTFADEYGHLGVGYVTDSVEYVFDLNENVGVPGEKLSFWRRAVLEMRNGVRLWRTIMKAREEDESDLERYVKWHHSELQADGCRGAVVVSREPGGGDSGVCKFQGGQLNSFKRSDLVGPAQELLRIDINRHLSGKLSPMVSWVGDGPKKTLAHLFLPSDLLGLMWFQFAEAFAGVTIFRPCRNERCRQLMLISPEGTGKRRQAKTCSDKCRFALYESRIAKAVSAFDQGEQLGKIALRTKAEPAVVQKWLARELVNRSKGPKDIAKTLGLSVTAVRVLLERKKRPTPKRNINS